MSALDSRQNPILFFDGVCGLCNRAVDFVLVRDKRRLFRFSPLQGETAREMLTPEDVGDLKSIALFEAGAILRKSDAALRILWLLGGGWRWLGFLGRVVPRGLRDWVYDFVASNRYRWFGKKETCRLPTREERQVFLD